MAIKVCSTAYNNLAKEKKKKAGNDPGVIVYLFLCRRSHFSITRVVRCRNGLRLIQYLYLNTCLHAAILRVSRSYLNF